MTPAQPPTLDTVPPVPKDSDPSSGATLTQATPTVLIHGVPSVRALNRYAIEALSKIVGSQWRISIGDAPDGGDALVQRWLKARRYPHVTIYHTTPQPKFNAGFEQMSQLADPLGDVLADMAKTATHGLVIVERAGRDTELPVIELLRGRFVKVVSPEGVKAYAPSVQSSTSPAAEPLSRPIPKPDPVRAAVIQKPSQLHKTLEPKGGVGKPVARMMSPAQPPTLLSSQSRQRRMSPQEFSQRFVEACTAHRFKVTECDPARAIVGPRVHRFYFRLKSGQRIELLQKVLPDLEREIGWSGLLMHPIPDSHDIALDCPHDKQEPLPLARALALIKKLELSGEALPVPVGVSPEGRDVIVDLSAGPHMLVAGTTGAGKTSFIHGLLLALIQTHPDPSTLRLFLASSKLEDFTCFAALPHLDGGKCHSDPAEALAAFQKFLSHDLPQREKLLIASGYANGFDYNRKRDRMSRDLPPMVPLVICVDEFADLVDEIDDRKARKSFYASVRRLAQVGRSKLIFLVIGTQRPSADLIPPGLRDLLNARVALRCNSNEASRMILNSSGAEKLLLKGDLLFQLDAHMSRLQGYFMPVDQVRRTLKQILLVKAGG